MTVSGELLLHAFEVSMAPVVPLILWFFLLKFVPPAIAALSPAHLTRTYGAIEGGAFIPWLVSAGTCAVGWWWYLVVSLPGWVPQDAGTVHSIPMERWFWALPALFLGIVTSPIPTYILMAPFLGSRFWGFIRQQDLKYGGYARTGLIIVAACAFINIPLLYCGWRATANFLPDRVILHHVFAAPTEHPYAAVKALEYARSYHKGWNCVIRLRFTDGTSWSGNNGDEDATRHRELEILRFVSRRSGIPIVELKE